MDSSIPPTYFSALHDEAFSLLVESRDYIAIVRTQRERGRRNKSDDLDLTLETMRLNTRLTQIMAWILAQRAVHNEELTPEEGASRAYRLSGQAICLDNVSGQAGHIPDALRDLLQRSYQLYQRVSRLEEQINGRMAVEEGAQRAAPADGLPYLRPVTTSDQSPRTVY